MEIGDRVKCTNGSGVAIVGRIAAEGEYLRHGEPCGYYILALDEGFYSEDRGTFVTHLVVNPELCEAV